MHLPADYNWKLGNKTKLLHTAGSLWRIIVWGYVLLLFHCCHTYSVLPLLFHDFIVFFMSSKSCGILQARILEWVAFPFSRGIFPTPGSNPGLPHCRQILYQLSHKGSPRILEWVSYPFSSGSSQPRNWTGVSCIAGGFFTNWAVREAQIIWFRNQNLQTSV